MSVGIYGGFGLSNLHVYSTTRPLHVIYFDGQSATLTALGTLDSQISILQGHVPLYPEYDLVYDEDQRALDLCDLVKKLGIDGVVRMNAGFEVLVCDYAAAQLQAIFLLRTSLCPATWKRIPKAFQATQTDNRQRASGTSSQSKVHMNGFAVLRGTMAVKGALPKAELSLTSVAWSLFTTPSWTGLM